MPSQVGRANARGWRRKWHFRALTGLEFWLDGSWNDVKVTERRAQEAEISGAAAGTGLVSRHVRGAFFETYGYDLGQSAKGFTS